MYLTGLGMHTAARLTFLLDGAYQRFQSEVGVDDSTGGRGSVRFRVFVDGREQFTSGPVRGGEPPRAVDLDILGAERLDLVVDFAERADVLDHANWLDARLVKPDKNSDAIMKEPEASRIGPPVILVPAVDSPFHTRTRCSPSPRPSNGPGVGWVSLRADPR